MYSKKCDCLIGIIVSIILGILIGYVFSLGLIVEIITALWIALGAAGIGLVLLIAIILFSRKEMDKCICINGKCLALGTFGTLVLSILALSMELSIFNVGIIILIGFLGAFVSLALISMAKLIWCLIDSKCKCKQD